MGAISARAEFAADQLSRDLRAVVANAEASDLRHAVTAS
jgi:hypothetical protein